MTKQKSALPFIGVPTTTPVTDAFLETGNQDMAGIRRTVANFFTEKAKRLRASPEDVTKTPLTVTEQIELFEQLQRLGAGPGDRLTAVTLRSQCGAAPMSTTWSVVPK
jgi:hypothetical protein